MQRPELDAPASEWLVYADALQVAGDARGELISLVHAEDAAARDAYVRAHAAALFGEAAQLYLAGAYRVTWRHGDIERAEVLVDATHDRSEAVHALLGAPVATGLRELAIIGVTPDKQPANLAPAIAAVAAASWPSHLTSLAIVDDRASRARTQIAREFGIDENLVQLGSLEAIWRLPQLAHLRLELADTQSLDLGAVDGSRLRSLTLRTLRFANGFTDEPSPWAEALGAATWPHLEELELRLAATYVANVPFERDPYVEVYSDEAGDLYERYEEADEYDSDTEPVTFDDLEPFLAKLVNAPLRRLALTSFASATQLLELLARTGLPRTLEVLDLSDSALSQEHVAWMREHATLFAPLRQLVLERTSIEDVSALSGLGPAVVHSHAANAPTYRYIVGSE